MLTLLSLGRSVAGCGCPLSRDSLEITIEDEDQFVNDFLGFVSILMGDLEDKTRMKQW